MEPVVFPTTIAPAAEQGRVKRSSAREDTGGGTAFVKYLRKKKKPPSGTDEPEEDDSRGDPKAKAGEAQPLAGANPVDGAAGEADKPGRKLIDVRV